MRESNCYELLHVIGKPGQFLICDSTTQDIMRILDYYLGAFPHHLTQKHTVYGKQHRTMVSNNRQTMSSR